MYGGPESLDALQLKKTPANRKKKMLQKHTKSHKFNSTTVTSRDSIILSGKNPTITQTW